MENIPELNDLDIFCAEQQLREKIYELQEKSVGIVSFTFIWYKSFCNNIRILNLYIK